MLYLYIGWIGSVLLAICAVPQVLKTWKTKKADDLSWLFLIFWLLGEALTLSYIIYSDILIKYAHYPLYLNYMLNIILVFYLVYAKIVYKK
jgi:uncharacterized protein with PQ loop repeat